MRRKPALVKPPVQGVMEGVQLTTMGEGAGVPPQEIAHGGQPLELRARRRQTLRMRGRILQTTVFFIFPIIHRTFQTHLVFNSNLITQSL